MGRREGREIASNCESVSNRMGNPTDVINVDVCLQF
jgi:hypothetical protein